MAEQIIPTTFDADVVVEVGGAPDLERAYEGEVWPNMATPLCSIVSGAGADTYCAWTRVVDDGAGNNAPAVEYLDDFVFASEKPVVFEDLLIYKAEDTLTFVGQLAYFPEGILICEFNITWPPAPWWIPCRNVEVPVGKQIMMRAMSTGGGGCEMWMNFRFHLVDD